MKTKIIILAIVMIALGNRVSAQKQVQHMDQIWLAYFNQARLSDKWGLWGDFHLRTKDDFVDDLNTSIIRAGITYYVHDQLRLTAGYAYVNHFPPDDQTKVSQPEHRPWQQVQWMQNSKRLRLSHILRLEERFRRRLTNNNTELGDGHLFNYRVRYNFLMLVPLHKNAFAPKTLSFTFNNEIHVNMGKEIVYNYFDQNRLFAGLTYHINPQNQLQFGYMYLFQQLAAPNRFRSVDAIRINYFQNLDFRKKSKL